MPSGSRSASGRPKSTSSCKPSRGSSTSSRWVTAKTIPPLIDNGASASYGRHMSRIVRRHPITLKARSIFLRRQGYSLDELCAQLQIPKTTIQGWVRSIPLSAVAKQRIQRRIAEGSRYGRPLALEENRRKLEAWKQGIREHAASLVKGLSLTPITGRAFCALLYRCEGSRYPSSRGLGFGNSDPRLIRLFLYLLRQYFSVDERKFRCQVMYRDDQSLPALIRYWSHVAGIPAQQFYLSKPDVRTKGKPTRRKDYQGVCYVQYLNVELQYTLQCLGEAIEEMVELEGVEPSSPQCHCGTLPLSYSPT